jgi:hypothetical protein
MTALDLVDDFGAGSPFRASFGPGARTRLIWRPRPSCSVAFKLGIDEPDEPLRRGLSIAPSTNLTNGSNVSCP